MEVWKRYIHGEEEVTRTINPVIKHSWDRSRKLVNPLQVKNDAILTSYELRTTKDHSSELIQIARQPMYDLYDIVKGLGYIVLLADAEGIILDAVGDPDFVDKATRVSLQPGACWREEVRGTNAIGTAIYDKHAIIVNGWEHFCQPNHFLTCSAVPICDQHNEIVGVLDISGDFHVADERLISTVKLAAMSIEQQLRWKQAVPNLSSHAVQGSFGMTSNSSKPPVKGRGKYTFDDIVGAATSLRSLVWKARKIANSSSSVLILGETGTGKEWFAHAVHNESNRRDKAFVAINCAAIPKELLESELFGYEDGAFTGAKRGGNKGKFELANGGTIFLDEIGDMPLSAQAALLRVLQEGEVTKVGGKENIPVDVRVIAATHTDLPLLVEQGKFRQDLFYRLKVISLMIPALRDRPEDILPLVEFYTHKFCQQFGLPLREWDVEAKEILVDYHWPGNVRELANLVEGIVQWSKEQVIDAKCLRKELKIEERKLIRPSLQTVRTLKEAEVEAIIAAIESQKGNLSAAARILDIGRNTLYRKIKDYNLEEVLG